MRETKWQQYMTKKDLAKNDFTALVRISDDQLDDEDYRVDLIVVRTGVVITQNTVVTGVYQLPNMVGWVVDDLYKWIKNTEDSVGSSPTNFYEINFVK